MKRQRLLLGMLPSVFAAFALLPSGAQAFPNGATMDCGFCHNTPGISPDTNLTVTITGSPTLQPDETDTYTLTIEQGLAGGAFNIFIADGSGTLGSSDPGVQVSGVELTHVDAGPGGVNRDLWVYNFTVMAPSGIGDTITLAAVGMQFNGDTVAAGDPWNNAMPFGITVVPEPGTAALLGLGLVGLAVSGRRSRA